MTARQKLQIEQSEKRQKINELLGIEPDQLTDENRAEMDQLTTRMQRIEPELRAAIVAEGAEQAQAAGQFSDVADGEQAEVRSLLQRVQIGDYLSPALGGVGLTGVPAELNAALKLETVGTDGSVQIPWVALLGTEQRALDGQPEQRAFTTAGTNNDGSLTQRPVLQRLFGMDVAMNLGVRVSEVPVGRHEIPVLTGGVTPAQTKEPDAAAAAVAATFDFTTHKPKRITGKYELSHELIASVSDVEQAIRRDLADAVKSQMVNLMINDTGPTNAAPQKVQGFLTAITAGTDVSAVSDFSAYGSAHSKNIDGIYSSKETEVGSVVGVDVLQHAASVYQSGSGESGSEALQRRSMSCLASSYIPAADSSSHKSTGNLFHSAGPNGGGPMMRTDAQISMWSTLNVIRDLYSQASSGIVLTWVGLWDFSVIRSAAYKRQSFQIGA